jgi:hypothetical protein
MAKSKARRSSARQPKVSVRERAQRLERIREETDRRIQTNLGRPHAMGEHGQSGTRRRSARAERAAPKRQASADAAPKVIALEPPCTGQELSDLRNILPISKRGTGSVSSFCCTIVPSDQQPERKVVETLEWLLSISTTQKREGS